MYTALNAALFSKDHRRIRPFWGYLRLLQQALDRLPESQAGAVFRGIKEPISKFYTLESLTAARDSGTPEIWWGFSSTSTELEVTKEFVGADTSKWRVIFTIDGGSSARDIRRYSHFAGEDELTLPCCTAFEVRPPGLLPRELLRP